MKNKYRVKVTVINLVLVEPETRYVIQEHNWFLGWTDYSDATKNKAWAYACCDEMNTSYEDIVKQRKMISKQ